MSNSLDTVKTAFPGDIVAPTDDGYAAAIARWAKNASRRAALVAFARTPADVALAIAYARAAGFPIAIKGGGHSASGASSAEGGLVIDLSRHMSGVRVDPEAKLGYVGGGALWETVDREAIAHGLATVGGTVNHVSALRRCEPGGMGGADAGVVDGRGRVCMYAFQWAPR